MIGGTTHPEDRALLKGIWLGFAIGCISTLGMVILLSGGL